MTGCGSPAITGTANCRSRPVAHDDSCPQQIEGDRIIARSCFHSLPQILILGHRLIGIASAEHVDVWRTARKSRYARINVAVRAIRHVIRGRLAGNYGAVVEVRASQADTCDGLRSALAGKKVFLKTSGSDLHLSIAYMPSHIGMKQSSNNSRLPPLFVCYAALPESAAGILTTAPHCDRIRCICT